jgi:phage anti-repressor protein
MSSPENVKLRDIFKHWAEQIESHQHQIFLETAKLVEMLKRNEVSARTKNEIIIVLKGLHATVKSVSKVLKKYT